MNESTDGSVQSTAFIVPDGAYVVDPKLSRVAFRAKAFGVKWVQGKIPVTEGELTVSENHVRGIGRLSADRIDTGLKPRDWHLRSSHYFHTAQHPTIAVAIDNMSLRRGEHPCEVTVKGVVSRGELSLETVQSVNNELHIEATMTLDRTVYPMLPPVAGVSRLAFLDITVIARRSPVF